MTFIDIYLPSFLLNGKLETSRVCVCVLMVLVDSLPRFTCRGVITEMCSRLNEIVNIVDARLPPFLGRPHASLRVHICSIVYILYLPELEGN